MLDRPMQTGTVSLEGKLVRLEPLTMDHLASLTEAAQDSRLWKWWTDPMQSEDDMRRYIQSGLDGVAAGTVMAWTTRSQKDGRIVGATRFSDINLRNRTLEIGWTWLHPDYQRKGINVEAKYLQLTHAFESMGARRVALKTHHHNLQSQTAIQALGAKPEGVFRNHVIMHDGSTRHTHWFSIIAEEWPEVKEGLERRMQRHSSQVI
ncbi:MAG TPA: GNAT family N-acetyltransferase [Alloacidobacterium sp.]|nr:GNAT family N-acetyltransferase [Alloacidobacterium sp.]